MASHVRQCGICDEEYDGEMQKPMMLPCGHSYCHSCLQKVEQTSCSKSCPFCRTEWSVAVEELPVCYQLIPEETSTNANIPIIKLETRATCKDHNFLFSFWCMSCENETCKMCVIDNHKNCDLILLEDAVKPNKSKFNKAFELIRSKIVTKQNNIKLCADANNECVASIQKFSKIVKKFEVELVTRQKNLEAQEKETIENIEMLDNRTISDERVEEELKLILEERICLYKLEKPFNWPTDHKMHPLCNIATTFQELEDESNSASFITKFCHAYHEFEPNNMWKIDDDASSVGALLTIVDLDQRPNVALVRSTENNPVKCLTFILPILATESNELRLELMDSFWPKINQYSRANDSCRITTLLASTQLSKLCHFFGFLDQASFQKINVTVLGLALYQPSDLNVVNTAIRMSLIQFHLSIQQSVAPTSLGALHVNLYTNCHCYLHFPHLSDDKIIWMTQIVGKLIPLTAVNQRIYSLCLPMNSLTVAGLEVLLGLVHGCQLTDTVWIGATNPNLNDAAMKKLKMRYVGYGVTLRTEESFVR